MILDELAVLTRDVHIRLLNCSETGCLVETNVPLAISTVAALTVQFEGRHFTDDVLVAWCRDIADSGPKYHVGLRFVWTAGIPHNSLRMMAHEMVASTRANAGDHLT